ncbi:SDR family oxidoreductase [soil metagenome]
MPTSENAEAVRSLDGKVAVVAGATRGAGRGIAIELGAAGAVVYCTGRSTREQPSDMNRPETIEETAELVTAAGGVGISVRVDHSGESEVRALFERVGAEQGGRLDTLVNDIWGGEKLVEWGKKFWELDVEQGLKLVERAVFTHLLTSRYGVPLMVAQASGLVLEMTDGDGLHYRGNLVYDFIKVGVMRLALAMAEDLKGTGVTAVALTPGFLRSEEMLEHFSVSEENWLDAAKQDPHFAGSETPHYLGRAVVALASDEHVHQKAGHTLSTWHLSEEYGFKDTDGRQPHWQRFFDEQKAQAS